MNTWDLREPSGPIKKENYPFSKKYQDLEGNGEWWVFAITQDEGMHPKFVSSKLKGFLDVIEIILKNCSIRKITIEQDTIRLAHVTGMNELRKNLIGYASDIESPWYYDEVSATIQCEGLTILFQPEADGMDLVAYFAGEMAEQAYDTLVSSDLLST